MSKPMIELTPEIESLIETRYHEYLKKGYSTKPANRGEVEAAITRIYKRDGIDAPDFKWVKSPAEAQAILEKHKVSSATTNLWGAYDLYWLAFYAVGREIGKLNGEDIFEKADSEELDDMLAISQATLWWPFDTCLVCDTPKEIHVDESGALHNDKGPAILYRDKVCLWMIHGVEVNEKIVMRPKSLTLKEINNEQNAEVKRIMIDRFGAWKYAEKVGARILDAGKMPLSGAAPRILVEVEGGGKWAVWSDGSTGKVFWNAVPRASEEIKNAHQAISFCEEAKIKGQS